MPGMLRYHEAVVPSDADSSLVGKVLDDRYEILEVIGEGGVGVVYRAHRVKLERVVAIKVLREAMVEDAGLVARFQREAVAMSRLYHPHCVAVTDFGVYQGRPYLVLEYLPGQTVTKLLEGGRFSAQRAVAIALQLLETLEYFHSHHVIHRDLKSENVMLVESSGTQDFVKVLDFGMAKILTGPGADSQLSTLGIVPGTPSAMAPEQIRQLPPDPRIDIYATGILLYEMVVGHRPFRGTDMATVIKMQVSTLPKRPREILGDGALSAELEDVIIKALEKDRLDRYATAGEMAASLRLTPEAMALASAGAEAWQRSSTEKAPRRAKWLPYAGLVAALAMAAVLAADRWPAGVWPSPAPPPKAAAAPPAPEPPPPVSLPPPPPEPVVEPWLAHRDLAVTYSSRGQQDDAFREVKSALEDSPDAAGTEPALVDVSVHALNVERIPFVIDNFRSSPHLVEALVEASVDPSADHELRHAAYAALRRLGEESRADLVAMQMLDVEQAKSCSSMRVAYRRLRRSRDPRFGDFKSELRQRGRHDRHVRCLRRLLRR